MLKLAATKLLNIFYVTKSFVIFFVGQILIKTTQSFRERFRLCFFVLRIEKSGKNSFGVDLSFLI